MIGDPTSDIVAAMEDDELAELNRWCAGDAAAGQALFKRHHEAVYRFLAAKVDSDLDDVVQETFLACVRSRKQFRKQSSFRTYLFAIARHVLYHHWRTRPQRAAAVDFDEVSIASLSTSVRGRLAKGDEYARLLDALSEIPLEQQLLLELYYWQGLEGEQLAEIFEVSPATIRSRLFRAREVLRDELARSAKHPVRQAADTESFDAWARSLPPIDAGIPERGTRRGH